MSSDLTPFPYQLVGADWLSKKKMALLADEMGLGKSAQTILAADIIGAKRILVLCPAVARVNWLREFKMWSKTPREFQIVRTKKEEAGNSHSVICSYDLANTSKILGEFDVLICDESHYLKSIDTKRTRTVFGRYGLVHRAKRTWCLSGTPAPNHPGELWPMLFTFGITKLSYADYIDRYCLGHDTSHGFRVSGARMANIPELTKVLDPFMLRRKKVAVLKELPPISYQSVVVEPGPVDIEIEASFVDYVYPTDRKKELFEKLEMERLTLETFTTAVGFSREGLKGLEVLAKSVATLRRYTGLQKVQAVADLVEAELTDYAYHKVVIFAVHRDVIEGLRVRLQKFKPVTLYGKTDPEKRTQNVDKFMRDDKTRVFIGNIQAAGTAITLTSAHNVIFIEQDWVPGNNAQAAMRCHRIGQSNPVVVRYVGLSDSIDEKISYLLKKKSKELAELFDQTDLSSSKHVANCTSTKDNESDGRA